ncbi:MAG: permease [Lysobacteraceae bacterium]
MSDILLPFLRFFVLDGVLLVSLFLLVTWGVVVAQQRMPFERTRARLLLHSGWRASFAASVGGVVTPFCSCSTIPVLNGMLRAGVAIAPGFAFLISSPVVNEGVFILLLITHGPVPALAFIAAGLAMTTAAGMIAARAGLGRFVRPNRAAVDDGEFVGTSGGPGWPGWRPASRFAWFAARQELGRFAPYLLAGLVVGGLIYGAVPEHVVTGLPDRVPPWALYLACALIGLPLYISPIAALPIGLALLAKGFPPGPLVTFLVASIGTSLPEVILLFRLFFWPLVLAHAVAVIACAIGLGLVVSLLT